MIDGRLSLAGADVSTFSLRRLLNVTYALLVQGKDAKEVAEFDVLLEGAESDSAVRLQVQATQEMAALMGMAAQ